MDDICRILHGIAACLVLSTILRVYFHVVIRKIASPNGSLGATAGQFYSNGDFGLSHHRLPLRLCIVWGAATMFNDADIPEKNVNCIKIQIRQAL